MKTIARWVYEMSGLSGIPSPWAASILIHLALAVYAALLAAALVKFRSKLTSGPTVRRFTAFFCFCLVFGAGAVGAVALQSFVYYGHGVNGQSAYTTFSTVMFLAALVPFWVILAKGGFFRAGAAA